LTVATAFAAFVQLSATIMASGLRSAMPTKSDEAAKTLYQSIMEEVKIRAYSINTATNIPNELPLPLVREYCFLQLRMICELVALGCLVAHGDISKTKYFQKAYKADDILKRLEELHPDFFPYPVKPIITPASPGFAGSVHLEDVHTDYLKKEELIRLYGKCGDVLHKGNLRRLLSPKTVSAERPYAEITEWGQKMLDLLSGHRISRIGRRFHLLAFLQVDPLGGAVQVAIAESPAQK
jgi:hypothetical protein